MPRKSNKKRDDGRIAVQVYIGRSPEGKRKYKTVYGKTQKEADAKADELKLLLRKGIDITSNNDTFSTWSERWLNIKETEVSHGQAVSYKSALNHLNSHVGVVPISKVRTIDLQEIITDLAKHNPNTGKPSSKQTLRVIKITASQVFRLAIENRVLEYDPAAAVKLPSSSPAGQRRALTSEEQQWIADTPHRAQRAAMIMMYAGLRRGELIPLTWHDVDLKNKTITVNKSSECINGNFEVKGSAKTKSGMRAVSIPQILVDYLVCEKHEGIYVCANSNNGGMHTGSSWKRMWDSYLCDLNIKYGAFANRPKSKFDPKGIPFVIPHFTPHWLRHTFASILYMAGVDVLTAKEQLGHSDIKTTLQIYTHLDNRHKLRSMNKVNEYINNASHVQVSKKL